MADSVKKFDVRVLNVINEIANSETPDIIDSSPVEEISFHDYVKALLGERHMSKGKMLDDIMVERSYGYQMLNGRRTPTREVIIRIILYLGLDIRESQFLLAVTGKQALYPSNRFEAAIIYGITHHMDIDSVEEMLIDKKIGSLFEADFE